MDRRLKLHNKLVELLGANHVYFQPPASLQMQYPCYVYNLSRIETMYGNNSPYNNKLRYTITYITKNPDDPLIEATAMLPMTSFDRYYKADNLNHYSYISYC